MNPTIRQAIARIDVGPGSQSGSRGTGALVTDDLVLTAMHVVADRSAPTLTLYPGTIRLTFPGHVTEANVVDRGWNPAADWILLRCVTPPPFAPLPLADTAADHGTWETYGFPDANPRDGMVQAGTIENVSGVFEGVAAFQLFSNQAAAGAGAPVKGLSGGPVIVDGALVAVLRSSLMRDGLNVAGTLYGCPVDLVLQATGDLLPVPDPCRGLPGLPRQPLPASPFRFLDRFTATDAEIFFGRNREIRQLRDTVIAEGGPSIVLLYGQSGAGKSSFLDAGLLPRLVAGYSVSYHRRDRGKGLLGTLLDGLRAQVAARHAAPATAGADALRLAWLEAEAAAGKPVVIVLDQVEEVFTQPGQSGDELAAFIDAVGSAFGATARPSGRLILGFRKEWFAEIQKQLEERDVEFAKVFLQTLDAPAIVEVITGLQSTKRLRDRYGLDLEPGLAAKISRDLSADSDSPVAPTLQVLLSKMWREATAANAHAPRFSEALYERLNKDGLLLSDFFDQQLTALQQSATEAGGTRADVVASGFAVDVLVYHTNAFGAAEQRSAADLKTTYGHRPDDAGWVVQELKRLYLLTDPAGDDDQTRTAARLSHDTLANVVRARFEVSGRPGQRARRVLENRAPEWSQDRHGVPLDGRDLDLVEQGLSGMRRLLPDEERLLGASREEARRRQRGDANRRRAAIGAAMAIVIAIGIGAWSRLLEWRQQQWTALFALDALVPVLLEIEPVNGLVAAVHAIDRNLTLNDNVLLPGTRGNLVRALDGARERVGWRLDNEFAYAIDVGPDDRIAVGTNNGLVRVFNKDGTAAIEAIRGAGSSTAIESVAFSADGEFLAAAMADQGLGIWTAAAQPISPEELPLGRATAVRFAPDGHTLLAAFTVRRERTLLVLDLDTNTAVARPIAVRGDVTSMATVRTPDGRLLIGTAAGDGSILTETGALGWKPEVALGSVVAVDIALVRESDLTDAASPAPPRVLLATGSDDGSVRVWDTSNEVDGRKVPFWSFQLPAGRVVLAFGHQGRLLHAASVDGVVRTYDLARKVEATDRFTTAAAPQALRASVDGQRVVTVAIKDAGVSMGSFVQTFDLAGPQLLFPLRAPSMAGDTQLPGITALTFAGPDTLIVGAPGNAVPRWHLKGDPLDAWANPELSWIDGGQDETTAVASDPDGRVILLAGKEKVQFLFNGTRVAGSANLTAAANSAAVSQDGSKAIVASDDGNVTLWDTATGRLALTVQGDFARSVVFNAAGTRFASGGVGQVIRVWNADGSPRAAFERDVDPVALVYHPKDDTIFAGDSTGRVQQLDEQGRALITAQVFRGEAISKMVIDPEGTTVFVAGAHGIRVLDVASGSVLSLRFPRTPVAIKALALRHDGTLLAGATDTGEVILWRAHWRVWLAQACSRLNDHAVFQLADGPVPVAITNTHVDYAAAAQSCATHSPQQISVKSRR